MSARWTGSATDRVLACPASLALPSAFGEGSDHADDGQQIHAFLYTSLTRGRAVALAEVRDADVRARCEQIDLHVLESIGRVVDVEVAYAYDVATDEARILGRNLGRQYVGLSETEVPTTTDIELEADDGVRVLLDAKSGWRRVNADASGQLGFHALAALMARRLDRVRVGILRIGPDGHTVTPEIVERSDLDCGAFSHQVREAWDAVQAARALVAAGGVPNVTTGDHCRYCPVVACPARVALARSVLSRDPATIGELIATMTPAEAGDLWERYKAGEALIEAIGEALRALAMRAPLELPDGRTLEMVQQSRTSVVRIPDPSGATKTSTFYVARPRGKKRRELPVYVDTCAPSPVDDPPTYEGP